jgi:hypothetical protein
MSVATSPMLGTTDLTLVCDYMHASTHTHTYTSAHTTQHRPQVAPRTWTSAPASGAQATHESAGYSSLLLPYHTTGTPHGVQQSPMSLATSPMPGTTDPTLAPEQSANLASLASTVVGETAAAGNNFDYFSASGDLGYGGFGASQQMQPLNIGNGPGEHGAFANSMRWFFLVLFFWRGRGKGGGEGKGCLVCIRS